ncbi:MULTISPECIES: cupin domain-containing protein [unclassified Pseudonocardia]|jgi:quercetin dioxygenase-like cupin family protein|uniref:cupin domain-containing protein n=1 Tax=unclassified Pseudonocardia TaxID=2619320 RepID=UPI000968A87D|nr:MULTISPECIES: cupin domain-containing protein [unclassified Pseudonocardia]MBN9103167.1 cupin domain-containing protein [Pseudonocardia sp.]OJY42682.1 MAG: cupin [Pseudonocardia sp. 73-21]
MPVVRHADARRTATPNAVMTTLASPTQGGTGLAVWQVRMDPGASGPPHRFDAEQVWTVLTGSARIELDGAEHAVGEGDTVVMPAGVPRRVHAGERPFTAVVAAPAGARATADGADPVLPAWIA